MFMQTNQTYLYNITNLSIQFSLH